MILVGIDPGVHGAVAIGPDRVFDCPTMQIRSGKSLKTVGNPNLMADLLRPLSPENCDEGAHVFIEKVHAMPKQGVTSMFNFGMNYGVWIGIVAALRIPMTTVTPQAWKKVVLAGSHTDKDASRQRALQLMPFMSDFISRKKDEGRAEALLIGWYGSLSLGGMK